MGDHPLEVVQGGRVCRVSGSDLQDVPVYPVPLMELTQDYSTLSRRLVLDLGLDHLELLLHLVQWLQE